MLIGEVFADDCEQSALLILFNMPSFINALPKTITNQRT